MSSRWIHRAIPLLALSVLACGDSASEVQAPDAASEIAADAGSDSGAVPSERNALFAFLQAGGYASFDAEPAVHASTGPHGQVRSFFNPALSASLSAAADSHPIGAAVIKELHRSGSLSGWAVMVKTASAGAAADWYYYEVLSTTDGSSPVADGQGISGCANCHSAGADYIVTSFP